MMKNSSRFTNQIYTSYIKDLNDSKPLTLKEEREFLLKIKNGDEKAKLEFYYRHLKFVVSIAKEYYDEFLNLNDLINEGNIGLIKAMDKYDFSVKTRFMSYAVWWIRQQITHSINKNSKTIRIPENILNDIRNNSNSKEIPKCVPLIQNEDEDNYDLSNFYLIEDEIEDISDLKIELNKILNSLNKKDSEIIKMSFGLDGYEIMSLGEISEEFKLSKERVRQIKNNALRKLKHKSKGLLGFR